MKFVNLLLILTLTSCFFFSKKEQAKEDIKRYYYAVNQQTGSGQTVITSIEIISESHNEIQAYIEGYSTNKSLAVPEFRDIQDTLTFQYYGDDEQRNLKIVSKNK